MRRSGLKHTVAVLRVFLGLHQKELAELVDRSTRTIQAVEVGPLVLGEGLGQEIAAATGVSLEWLMRNDTSAPIIDKWGKPYTKECFERAQSKQPRTTGLVMNNFLDSAHTLGVCIAQIARADLVAHDQNQAELFNYRITNAVGKVVSAYKGHVDFLKKWENNLAMGYDMGGLGNVIDGMLRDWRDRLETKAQADFGKARGVKKAGRKASASA